MDEEITSAAAPGDPVWIKTREKRQIKWIKGKLISVGTYVVEVEDEDGGEHCVLMYDVFKRGKKKKKS